MKIQITGRHMEVGSSLEHHAREALTEAATKFFSDPIDAVVVFEKRGNQFLADIRAHISQGLDVVSHGKDTNVYTSFDIALSRLKTRVRRYKKRLKDHHSSLTKEDKVEIARNYILDAEKERDHEDLHPSIIADMDLPVSNLTVGEAVMQMDLRDLNVHIFRNEASGDINFLYRREDGNIGWVDPKNLTKK